MPTMIWLTCLSILGYCLALARFSTWRIEQTPFFVISSIITLLTIFAYCQFLEIGADLLLGLGGLLFLFSPIFLQRKLFFQNYATPGMVISVAFIGLFLYLAQHVRFSNWDEFTHWGPHAKLVDDHNGLLIASDSAIHKSYPLGGALFQYYFFRLSGFSEGVAYAAQCVLLMAPLPILITYFDWRYWKKALIAYSFALFSLLLLKVQIGPVDSLYMDPVVGIYFGMSMVAFFSSDKKTSDILFLIPVISALMLFKQKLLPFVLIITVVIGIAQWLKNKKFNISSMMAILLLPFAAWLITHSWHRYLASIHVPVEWKLNITWQSLRGAFLSPAGSTAHTIIANYCHVLFPVFLFVVIMILLNAIAFYFSKNKKSIILAINAILLLGFGIYVFGLLLLYLFSFSAYEGIMHASMGRYLSIYYIGWMLTTLYFLFDVFRSARFFPRVENISIAVIIAALIYFIYPHNASHQRYRDLLPLRKPITQIADAVKAQTKNNARIFTIWQNSTGLERGILLYELTPRKSNMDCTSFGKPYTKGDVWTCDITPQQLQRQISHYQYLLLAYTDKNFWQHYQSILPNKNKLQTLVTYMICKGNGFNSFNKPGCKMKRHHAYLIKQ